LQNGDKLTGALGLGPIDLRTTFGKVLIRLEHIRKITIRTSLLGTRMADAVAALRRGLVAYYPFDRDTHDYGTKADNALATQGGSVTAAKGKVGGAYVFNGSGAYLSGSVPAPTLTGDWTLAAWFTHTSLIGWEAIISFNPDWSQSPVMSIRGGSTEFGLNQVGVGDSGVFVDLGADHYNKWIFAVIRKTGKANINITAYVNGREITNSGNVGWRLGTSPKFYIGRDLEPSQIWSGIIDEVSVWDRALSPSEISDLYNNGQGLSLMPPGH